MRQSPNIIVTGTPGVGKTTHCEGLAERTGLRHLSVNQVVKDKECHEGWSDEFHSWIVDEDKENLDSEIMEVLLQEARDAFDSEIVIELTSNEADEMESNVERIEGWVKQWKQDNQ
ncbi:putative FAP7-involved in the oxidative stress response [Ilyonectria robusta]